MQGADQPRVTIVIAAYHGAKWIPGCLQSLSESLQTPVRLVLVDNGGNEDCIPAEVPCAELIVLKTERSLGFAEANNFALEEAGGGTDYVCFLNQDTLCRRGWLEECVSVLDSHPQVGAVTPMLLQFGWHDWNPNFLSCAKVNPDLHDRMIRRESIGRPFEPVPDIPAACMLIRSELLERVGPFDPVYGSYYEDFDLCLRCRNAGSRVGVCPQAEVAHYDSVTDAHVNNARNRNRQRLVLRNRTILKVRAASNSRTRVLAKQLLIEFPRQTLRAVLGREGSKSVRAVLMAAWSLLPVMPRLVSRKTDQRIWDAYLQHFRRRFAGAARVSGNREEAHRSPGV